MKKILLASTALVGFAGAAAAEVSLTGYAEMGIFGGDDVETQFHNDVVINFNFSGSTDNGLEFGGKVQLDDTNGSDAINGAPGYDDEAFWVSGAFGKVTLGETDGAFDWALSEIYTGTSLFDDHSTHAGAYWFTGLDGNYDNQIVRYEYSFGAFGVAISAEMDDDINTGTAGDGVTADTSWALGGKWADNVSGVDVGLGVGVQDNGTNTVWGLSASAGFSNGFSAALGYADLDGVVSHSNTTAGVTALADDWWGLGVAYTTGDLTVGANYGSYDTDLGDFSGFGLVANYNLGGGAVLMAGYGSSDVPAAASGAIGSFNGNGEDTFSLGIGLSF